jgi:hypothetical protein
MTKQLLLQIPFSLAALVLGLSSVVAAAEKPNIIFILGDDVAQGDLGCYGQKFIKTPHLDRMAAEGTRYNQAYAGTSVCAPSRTSLMTGLHIGQRLGVQSEFGGRPVLRSKHGGQAARHQTQHV